MRADRVRFVPFVVALGFTACADKEAADPGMILREEMPVASASRAGTRSVRCACDDEGGLHIVAPRGSHVVASEQASGEAAAEIILPDDAEPAGPVRRTRSLGFIGDGKLTQGPSRGGPWNVPDALLPAHRHVEPRYNYGFSRGGGGRYVYGHRGWR